MPYVLPTPEPRKKFIDYLGDWHGKNLQVARDVLLQALTMGMYQGQGPMAPQNIPNPGYGQSGSAGTSFSPAGANQSPLAPPSTARYQPPISPAPYSKQPMLNQSQFDRLIKNQEYQSNAAKLDPNSIARQLEKAKLGESQSYSKYLDSLSSPQQTPPTPTGLSPEDEQKLLQAALAGDDESEQIARALGLF